MAVGSSRPFDDPQLDYPQRSNTTACRLTGKTGQNFVGHLADHCKVIPIENIFASISYSK
jgi:hypothetical protein